MQSGYVLVVNCFSAEEMVKKFQELDKDGSGKLDVDEAREGLKSVQMGRYLLIVTLITIQMDRYLLWLLPALQINNKYVLLYDNEPVNS